MNVYDVDLDRMLATSGDPASWEQRTRSSTETDGEGWGVLRGTGAPAHRLRGVIHSPTAEQSRAAALRPTVVVPCRQREDAAVTDVAERRLNQQLRTWATGVYPVEAATELLIRTGRARATDPWIKPFGAEEGGPHAGHWVDFDIIPDHLHGRSGGERRLLLIAAALGSDTATVNLADALTGLDRTRLGLVLAGIAHAAGSHEGVLTTVTGTRLDVRDVPGPLYPWPDAHEQPPRPDRPARPPHPPPAGVDRRTAPPQR